MQPTEENSPSLEDQFQIYAKELGELYRVEQARRTELAEEKLVLEQRVKALEALNNMFQSHLARRIELEDALRSLLDRLDAMAREESIEKVRLEMAHASNEIRMVLFMEPLTNPERPPD